MATVEDDKVLLRIVLPFKLPTWNQILALPLKDRMRLKRLTHGLVFTSTLNEIDSVTPTVSAPSTLSMALSVREYYMTIHPHTSKPSRIPRKKVSRKKRS